MTENKLQIIKEWKEDIKKLKPLLWKEYILSMDPSKQMKYAVLCEFSSLLQTYQTVYRHFQHQFAFDWIVTEECYQKCSFVLQVLDSIFREIFSVVPTLKHFLGSHENFQQLFPEKAEISSIFEQLEFQCKNVPSFVVMEEYPLVADPNLIYQGSSMILVSLGELCLNSLLRNDCYETYLKYASICLSVHHEESLRFPSLDYPYANLENNANYVIDRNLKKAWVYDLYETKEFIFYGKYLLDSLLNNQRKPDEVSEKLERVIQKLEG